MTTYVMQARENYTADLQAEFATTWAIGTSQMYAGLSYDRVRRKIIYCANPVALNAQIGAPVSGTLVGGSGYTDGDYPGEPMTGGTGTGATCHLTISGGVVTACVAEGTGVGYVVSDVLSATRFIGGGTGFQWTLTAVSAGALNSTGHNLWSGQTLITNGSNYDGTLFKNHSTMVKDIATDGVTRYDAWSSTNTVPNGAGGGSPTAGSITNAGSSYVDDTYFYVPLTGGSGHGASANVTVSGGVVTVVTPLGGHGYVNGDVLSPLNTYMNGAGSGAQWTVSAVTTGSDGTWRRVVASDAVLVDQFCSINIPRFVDPRTGDVWAHHESDPPTTCEIYLLRKSDNYQQIISPLQPIPGGGIHMQPMALTSNYLWVLNQQNMTGSSYLVGTPRTITAAETTADYLLPYPWYTWPFNDWTSNNHPQWYSRCCVDLSNNLYFLNWNYSTTGVTRTYTLQQFTEPSAASPYNTSVVGGGFTDITPWSSTTGPNTGLPANGTHNSYLSTWGVTKTTLLFLPTSNNLVAITKIFCQDLGQTWNSTNQGNVHFDATYIDLTHNTFDYHANWLTGYLDASLNPTVLASASWALLDYLELDTDLNIQSYDFTSTGVDYTKRWFFLILSPVTGGTWTPPSGTFDGANRTCLIQVQFTPGRAPTIIQTIFDTGWNSTYASFGTTIGNPNVITATAIDTISSVALFTFDSGIYDSVSQSWWWSGQTFAMFQLNSAFAPRETAAIGTVGVSPPFLFMSLGFVPPPTGGKGKTYMRICKKKRGTPTVQRLAVGSAAGAGNAAASVQHGSLAVGTAAGAGAALGTTGGIISAVGSAVGAGTALGFASGAAVAVGSAVGAGAASAVGSSKASSVGTSAGAGAASATASGGITTFTIANFSGSSSKCRYRRGLWFKKGDIPAGSVPVIKQGSTTITAQFDERKTWSDGSLALCSMSLIDTDFAGSETRTYTITAATGAYNNTSLRTLADVTGVHHAFNVAFTGLTQNNGSGPITRGSGAFTAAFNTQSAVATRVYQYHSGPVCTSWEVWGMATDNVGGDADPHLKTVWYVTAWNNSDGTFNDVEYGAVIAQDWWNVPNKFLLGYTAALNDGVTGIQTYSGIQHPYQAQMMTVRLANDNNHARRFWANAIPTLYHTFDKNYARSTGLFPYLSPTFAPNSSASQGYPNTYTPFSAQCFNAVVDAAGGSPGRGLISDPDCIAWMNQDPADNRCARASAFAGLSVGFHYKSNANRTISSGPQAGTDVANTVISMIMRPLFAPAYDFTAQGMPAPIDAYTGSCNPPVSATYVPYTGGTGVWTYSNPQDTSHAVAYCYGMYMLEGERHFMQATLELATNAAHGIDGNQYAGAPVALYNSIPPYQALLSIPSTQYSGIGNGRPVGGNQRNVGWGTNLLAQAAVVCPDADVQAGFIKLFQSQQTAYQVFSATYYVAGQLATGILGPMWSTSDGGIFIDAPWMDNFCTQGLSFAAIACEDTNAKSMVNNILQYSAIGPWNGQPYRSKSYRQCPVLNCDQEYNASTNPFLSLAAINQQLTVSIAGNVITLPPNVNTPTNGDFIYFLTQDDAFNPVSVPSGTSEAVKYFAVNCTASTLQIAATPGGSPMTIGSGSDFSIGWQPVKYAVTPAGTGGQPSVAPDDYPPISNAALVMASKVPGNSVTPTQLTNASNFLSTVDFTIFSTWNLVA